MERPSSQVREVSRYERNNEGSNAYISRVTVTSDHLDQVTHRKKREIFRASEVGSEGGKYNHFLEPSVDQNFRIKHTAIIDMRLPVKPIQIR